MIQIYGYPIYVIICLAFLVLLSIIDLKTYKREVGLIPSFLTMLFILLIFIAVGFPQNVYLGSLALIMALTFADLGMYWGNADLKVLIAVGMTFPNIIAFLVYTLLLSCFSLVFKFIIKKKYPAEKEIPFIPIFLFTYIVCIIIGALLKMMGG